MTHSANADGPLNKREQAQLTRALRRAGRASPGQATVDAIVGAVFVIFERRAYVRERKATSQFVDQFRGMKGITVAGRKRKKIRA